MAKTRRIYSKLSLVERAVLEAVSKCPRPQIRCLIKKARALFPQWGLDKQDIIWGVKRLKSAGILSGRYGKQGRAAIFYRYTNPRRSRKRRPWYVIPPGKIQATRRKMVRWRKYAKRRRRLSRLRMTKRIHKNSSAVHKKARVLRGPTPKEAKRLLQRYYRLARRHNPRRPSSYQVWFQKLVQRETKKLKRQARRIRLAGLRAKKRGPR